MVTNVTLHSIFSSYAEYIDHQKDLQNMTINIISHWPQITGAIGRSVNSGGCGEGVTLQQIK